MKTRMLASLIVCLLAGATSAKAGFIDFSASATNGQSSPTTFAFNFSNPITPILGLADYSFSSNISLTDGGGFVGVSAAVGVLPEFWRLQIGDSAAVLTLLDDVGGSASLVGAGPYNFSASGTFDCSALPGGCSSLEVGFSFLLSGGGDQLSSSGTFDLSPHQSVPEPSILALFGAGLAGLALIRRRRKAKALLDSAEQRA
jgi:hypothetical protein